MVVTIKISNELQRELAKKKIFDDEPYEEVIWGLIENDMELNEETKREIAEARKEIKEGKFYTLEEVKKRLDIK